MDKKKYQKRKENNMLKNKLISDTWLIFFPSQIKKDLVPFDLNFS